MAERTLTKEEIAANVRKANAEAELALAAVDEKRALARVHEADAAARATEEEHTKFLIAHAKIENQIAEIAFAKCDREESFAKVSDLYNRVYTFDDAVTERSIKICVQTLTAWSRQEPGCDITIYLNSPGGSILDGFALIDFILELRRKGHKVTTIALGMAASMAGVILQAGTVRAIGSNAILLIHEGSLGAIGSFGEVEDRVKLMKIFHERILDLFEERAKPINSKTTKAFIRKNWDRTDWWIGSSQALELGLVDEVR